VIVVGGGGGLVALFGVGNLGSGGGVVGWAAFWGFVGVCVGSLKVCGVGRYSLGIAVVHVKHRLDPTTNS